MSHKNEENANDSSHNEIVIDLTKCGENPSPNRDDKMRVCAIDVMGSKKGKSSVLNYLLNDMMSDSEKSTEDGSFDEIDIEEEDKPCAPILSRRRVKGSAHKQ